MCEYSVCGCTCGLQWRWQPRPRAGRLWATRSRMAASPLETRSSGCRTRRRSAAPPDPHRSPGHLGGLEPERERESSVRETHSPHVLSVDAHMRTQTYWGRWVWPSWTSALRRGPGTRTASHQSGQRTGSPDCTAPTPARATHGTWARLGRKDTHSRFNKHTNIEDHLYHAD